MYLLSRLQKKPGMGRFVSAVTRRAASKGSLGLLDPDVAGVLLGLEERDVLAVGRELRAGDLGVAEEQLAVDEGRRGGGRRSGHEAEGERRPPAGRFERVDSWVQGLRRKGKRPRTQGLAGGR